MQVLISRMLNYTRELLNKYNRAFSKRNPKKPIIVYTINNLKK